MKLAVTYKTDPDPQAFDNLLRHIERCEWEAWESEAKAKMIGIESRLSDCTPRGEVVTPELPRPLGISRTSWPRTWELGQWQTPWSRTSRTVLETQAWLPTH